MRFFLFCEGLFGELKSCTVHVEHAYILHTQYYFLQRAFWNAANDTSGHSSLPLDDALVPGQPGSKEAVTTSKRNPYAFLAGQPLCQFMLKSLKGAPPTPHVHPSYAWSRLFPPLQWRDPDLLPRQPVFTLV